MTMGKIKDIDISQLAYQAYEEYTENIQITIGKEAIIWKTVDTLQVKETGLNGYIFENETTGEIVVSFEGTQLEKGTTQALNDLTEDIQGIVFGDSNYTTREQKSGVYRGTPSQDARIASGDAKVDSKGNFITITENQFTVANDIVNETINKYGKDNVTFTGHSLGGGLAEYFAVKYDTDAITFASAPIIDLLSPEEQKRVKNGDFKDQIISYTYPDDMVGTFKSSVGSVYFMSNPQEIENINLDNHGRDNFNLKSNFDENGYFKAEMLYDETLHRPLTISPLELKNKGVHGFGIIIKAQLLKAFSRDLENNADLIASTEKSFSNFYDYYINTIKDIKSKYYNLVGTGKYDMLSPSDVDDILASMGTQHYGVPVLFNTDHYEEILQSLNKVKHDTAEIAHHMEKMGNDFEETDYILAQWLGLKQ